MDRRQGTYYAYMLRLWRGITEGDSSWRASLEDPETGTRQGFADMQELFGYLKDRTDEQADAPADPEGGR